MSSPAKLLFTIIGPPRTKGNSFRVVIRNDRPRVLPSKPYTIWFRAARLQINLQRVAQGLRAPLERPVHVRAQFYRARAVGDIDNYAKALGDCLQRSGVLANDKLIASWDGTRLLVDHARPRVELAITEIRNAKQEGSASAREKGRGSQARAGARRKSSGGRARAAAR